MASSHLVRPFDFLSWSSSKRYLPGPSIFRVKALPNGIYLGVPPWYLGTQPILAFSAEGVKRCGLCVCSPGGCLRFSTGRVQLLAGAAPMTGAWIHALPTLGLCLSNLEVRELCGWSAIRLLYSSEHVCICG